MVCVVDATPRNGWSGAAGWPPSAGVPLKVADRVTVWSFPPLPMRCTVSRDGLARAGRMNGGDEVVGGVDGCAVDGDDHVVALQPARRSRRSRGDLHQLGAQVLFFHLIAELTESDNFGRRGGARPSAGRPGTTAGTVAWCRAPHRQV